jgi:tRNA U34 5-methylaminomethyl-2-thiouridine-forming methyltransferase MnmC
MDDEFIIKQTGDGSTTFISKNFDQPFHSLGGAVAESRYVYFEASGLADQLIDPESKKLNVLEIGFGSGLNFIMLIDYLKRPESNQKISFTSVEAYPVHPDLIPEINFGQEVDDSTYHKLLKDIFTKAEPGWNSFSITENLTLNLFVGMFDELNNPNGCSYDFIMHDPFSPGANPAGWTAGLFAKIASWSSDQAMLSTYCAATSARAAMAAGGWKIARAPGALGKREMTVASINPKNLSHLKRVNEQRLVERFESGEFA